MEKLALLGGTPDFQELATDKEIFRWPIITQEDKDALNEVKDIQDENILKQKYNRIIEIAKVEVQYIGLYFETKQIVYSKGIVGNFEPTAFNAFNNIETWYRKK